MSAKDPTIVIGVPGPWVDEGDLGRRLKGLTYELYDRDETLAHSADTWRALAANPAPLALYRHFVVTVTGQNSAHSCGMHQFGLPDALAIGRTTAECSQVVDAFCRYLLLEAPTIHSGHTFSAQSESTLFDLALEPDAVFDEGDLFWNPFGRWQLRPAAAGHRILQSS